MSTTFRPRPDQSLLLPPDVREWLPEGHLAHHVSDLVDGLDLTAFYVPYEGDGRRNAPYAPRMMVKVLLYAYATGVFSREIARKLEEDVAFRMLAAGNFPQHRTLCEFRRRHLADFQALFVEVVGLAQVIGSGALAWDEGARERERCPVRKAVCATTGCGRRNGAWGAVAPGGRGSHGRTRLGPEVRGDELGGVAPAGGLAAIRAAKAVWKRCSGGGRRGGARTGTRRADRRRAYGEPDEGASNFTARKARS